MVKQDLSTMFDYLRDNNDFGAREYRVAELMAPFVGTDAPVDDTDLALFTGQEYINTTTGKKYYATAVTATTTTWVDVEIRPLTGAVAPVDDTDLAVFNGQFYIDTVLGKAYYATAVTATTTTWKEVSTV